MKADYVIRSAAPEDLSPICKLNDLAFGSPDEGRIVETLIEDGQSLLSLIAKAPNGEIIGHIQFFPIDVNAAAPSRIAGLGPMSVHPDHQKSGIGGKLIRYGLDALASQGAHRVFVLGHPEYYPKFGFSVDATAGFSAPWGGPAFMAIELNKGGPEFGGLHYPAAFSEG